MTRLYLQYDDPDYAAMRTIADADENECQKLDLLTPLSDEAQKKASNPPVIQHAYLIDDPPSVPGEQRDDEISQPENHIRNCCGAQFVVPV